MQYYFAIYIEKQLQWQFSLDCKNEHDALMKGNDAKIKWLEDWKTEYAFKEAEVRHCTMSAWIKALKFRGKEYV